MNNLIGRGVFHSERLSCKRDTGSSHHSEKFFCGILLFLQLDGNGVLPVLLPYKKGDEKITLEMDLCRYVGINPVFRHSEPNILIIKAYLSGKYFVNISE
jgi:hypothetical protein